jgi:hypothetical protein
VTLVERLRRFLRDPVSWGPWIFLAVAIYTQLQAGLPILPRDLADEQSDSAAHFTTGVMLYDYLRLDHFTKPLPFAECFYVQYPKVALGHWPPVFYVLEALWFLAFSATPAAARCLCACVAGLCALILYRCCRVDWGRWHAVAAASLFLAMPAVREQTWSVMSDLLLACLTLLALFRLSAFLKTGTIRDAIWLAAWTSMAILTKGTAWLLMVPIGVSPILVGRKIVYTNWRFWFAICLTWIASTPFYVLAVALGFAYPLKLAGHIHRLAVILHRLSVWEFLAGGLLVLVMAAALRRWLTRAALKPTQITPVILAIWGLTLVGFIQLFPLTREWNRYYMVAFAPMIYLLAGAMFTLERQLDSKLFRYLELSAVLWCGAALALTPMQFASTSAFSQAIGAIPVGKDRQLILIEGDPIGEGAMIAARLTQDRDRSSYLLRGTKFLATSEWGGARYSVTYNTSAELRTALESIQLEYIVLDQTAKPRPDTRLLEAALADPGWIWSVVDRIPINLGSRHGELLVYHRQTQGRSGVVPESVHLGPELGSKALACRAQKETMSSDPKHADR